MVIILKLQKILVYFRYALNKLKYTFKTIGLLLTSRAYGTYFAHHTFCFFRENKTLVYTLCILLIRKLSYIININQQYN